MRKLLLTLLLPLALLQSGCGYSQKSLLPSHIKSIHILPVKNTIDLSAEISDKDRFKVYRPGVEVELTNAIINRFIFDGTLQVSKSGAADAVVEAKLVDYRRDVLRYTNGDDVEEYRLSIVLDVTVTETQSQKQIWHETGLTGDTTFFLRNARAQTEDEAVAKAVDDTARRVVEKTVEIW